MENENGELKLDRHGQSAVIGLGIYYLESKLNFPTKPFPHKEKILPYFFNLIRSLPEAQWNDNHQLFPNRSLPTSECFVFCLTTFLCDVAVLDETPETRDEILEFQVFYLQEVAQLILRSKESVKEDDEQIRKIRNGILSKRIIPLFFGHARAMGRFTSDSQPLFLQIFSKPPSLSQVKEHGGLIKEGKHRSFTNFRSIFPRSLSLKFSSFPVVDSFQGASMCFRNFGHSFETSCQSILFSVPHMKTILKVAQALLQDKVSSYVDSLALEAFNLLPSGSGFPYKSFSESLNLVLVTVLKQVFSGHSQLPSNFMEDARDLVKLLFASGQTELQKRHMDHQKPVYLELKLSATLSSATK